MAAPAYVGSGNGGASSTTTPKTVSVTSVSAGYLIVVAIVQNSTGSNTYTVSDDQGHTYTKVAEQTGTGPRYTALYYTIVATTTAGTVVVSVAATGGIAYTCGALWASPPGGTTIQRDADSEFTDASNTTTHPCAASGEIDTAADVIVVATCSTTASMTTVTNPTNYTSRQTLFNNRSYLWSRESTTALTDEQASWGSASSIIGISCIASFKAVASGIVIPIVMHHRKQQEIS